MELSFGISFLLFFKNKLRKSKGVEVNCRDNFFRVNNQLFTCISASTVSLNAVLAISVSTKKKPCV